MLKHKRAQTKSKKQESKLNSNFNCCRLTCTRIQDEQKLSISIALFVMMRIMVE
jgi:hypothetical protein